MLNAKQFIGSAIFTKISEKIPCVCSYKSLSFYCFEFTHYNVTQQNTSKIKTTPSRTK